MCRPKITGTLYFTKEEHPPTGKAGESEIRLRKSILLTLACLLAWASAASAVTITVSGNFTADDDIVFYTYHVNNLGLVTVSTTSFATGGFSPILSLFDSTGAFQFDNQGYPTNSDATLTWNSIGGEDYIIALTEYFNFSIGPNLSDGFTQQGTGNFTGPANGGTGPFLLPGPEQRTSAWSIEFSSADPTLTVTPEPSTGLFGAGGCLALWVAARKRKRTIGKRQSN